MFCIYEKTWFKKYNFLIKNDFNKIEVVELVLSAL